MGRALKFYSSIRIQVARRSWITVPNKDPRNTANEAKIGLIMKGKVIKSKVCNPYSEVELPFFFDRGFVSHDDIKPIRAETMKANNERRGKDKSKNSDEEDD